MSGLSKIGACLTVIFILAVVALIGELVYVFWCRRKLRHPYPTGDNSSSETNTPPKELLYFTCWNTQNQTDPNGATPPSLEWTSPTAPPYTNDDFKKLQHELFGKTTVLVIIKEEERDRNSSERKERISLEDCVVAAGDTAEVPVMVGADDGITPFSTPCASPPYYTPSPSPPREVAGSGDDEVKVSSVLSLEIIGE